MNHPISERKRAANRANAKKSTGPKTPAGKRISSQNARTHGLTALTLPLLARDRARLQRLADDFRQQYLPATSIEEDWIDRVVLARFHLSQAERLLQGYWDLAENPHLPEPKRLIERHRCRRLAQHLITDCGGKNVLSRILRYKESARRDLVHCQKQLDALRKAEYETKPPQNRPDPLTNPAYRQDFYRHLQSAARKYPPASQDPSLPQNRPSSPPGPPPHR